MALATLSIDLVAKIAKFEADMGKAARETEKTAARINAAIGTAKAALGWLAAGISGVGIVNLAKATIDSLDALNDLKDATGASIENLSALEDVAARTGTSMDTVAGSLVKFNKVLSDAKPGSDAERALKAIGLNAEELKRIDPAEALRQTAVALSQFADDGDKARLVQKLFGKSAKETAPFLKDLAEQSKLVASVTTQEAEEAEKFNKALFALQKSTQDVARDLAGPMVKALNDVILKFQEGEKAGKSFLDVGLENYWTNVRKFWGIKQPESTSPEGSWGDPVIPAKPAVGPIPDKPTKTKTSSSTAKDPYAEVNRYIENLQKQIEKTQELTTVQQLGFDIVAGRMDKMTTDQQQQLIDLAQKLDTTKLQTEAEKELTKALADRVKAEQDSLAQIDNEYAALIQRLTANTPTGQFKSQQEDLAALQEALAQGAITEQVYAEAVAARFDINDDKLKKTKTLADDLGLTFASAFEDAIVQGGNLSDVLQGLEQDILRIVARKLVTEPIGNALSGAIGGMFAGLSFDGGGYTGNAARAGGLDGKGGFMAMLHPQETVVDHTRGQSADGSIVINIASPTIGDIASKADVVAGMRATASQIAAQIQRSRGYGGALA